MRKILLTDSMQEVLEDLALTLGEHFEVRTCDRGDKLQELLQSYQPHILLLDLSMPGYDPAAFLRSLPQHRPLIVATALNSSDYLIRLLEEVHVQALLTKPLHADGVTSCLLNMELQLDREPQLRSAVYESLLGVGISPRSSGFHILAEGLLYACRHGQYSLVDELYLYVARACCTTEIAVDMAMRRCIEQAYERAKVDMWEKLFGQKGCPPNGVFIKQLAHGIVKRPR